MAHFRPKRKVGPFDNGLRRSKFVSLTAMTLPRGAKAAKGRCASITVIPSGKSESLDICNSRHAGDDSPFMARRRVSVTHILLYREYVTAHAVSHAVTVSREVP
jgi:hypothetical protein